MSYIITQIDSDGSGSYDGGVQYTLVYTVHNPAGPIGPNTACNAVGWSYGNPYINVVENDSDTRANCVSITCDGNSSDDGWTRTVTVSFKQIPQEEKEKLENPFASIKESFKVQQDGELPIQIDVNGNPVKNKAGDPFGDITEAKYTGVLKITKNFPAPPMHLLYYIGKINADPFRGFPARTLKLVDIDEIQAESHPTAGVIFPVTLHFAFNPEGHKKKVLNEGFRAKNDRGVLEHIMVDGEKTTEPMMLTMDGKKAPANQYYWLDFQTAFSLPFGGLI